jgi:hypothetical protein
MAFQNKINMNKFKTKQNNCGGIKPQCEDEFYPIATHVPYPTHTKYKPTPTPQDYSPLICKFFKKFVFFN